MLEYKENGIYECPKCHEQLTLTFFGYCNKCQKSVGFWEFSWSNAVSGIGKWNRKGGNKRNPHPRLSS
jgi:hypothetical protein